MKKANSDSFPSSYHLPKNLSSRPLDILAIGSLILEQVIRVEKWPHWGGQDTFPVTSMSFSPGGCALNVSCFSGRLGGRAAIISSIGTGRFSGPIEAELAACQVDTRYLRRFEGRDGSLVLVIAGPKGDWTVMDYIDPEIRLHDADIPPEDMFAQVKIVHIDGYSFLSAGDEAAIEKAAQRAKEQGCILSVDASAPAVRSRLDFLRLLFKNADIGFANQKETQAITGAKSTPKILETLRAFGTKLFFIKQGQLGATLVTPGGYFKIPAYPVEVVDTIAAGDAFIAATLISLCQGESLWRAAQRGSAAGALACLGAGSLGSHFNLADIDRLIERFQ